MLQKSRYDLYNSRIWQKNILKHKREDVSIHFIRAVSIKEKPSLANVISE